MSGVKKPSLRGMSNTAYLGRFRKDKFIQEGHNTGFIIDKVTAEKDKKQKDISAAVAASFEAGAKSAKKKEEPKEPKEVDFDLDNDKENE